MSTTQQPILDAVWSLLATTAGVNTLVGGVTSPYAAGRIYDGMAEQGTNSPFITINVIADAPVMYFTIDSLDMTIQIDIWGDFHADPKTTRTIADAVYTALHRATPTVTGYGNVSLLCKDRGTVEPDYIAGGVTAKDKWRVIQTYRIQGSGT